jgi:tripartite ATP-independent transporter DctM subunit
MMVAVSFMARRRNFPVDESIPRSAYAAVYLQSILPLSLPAILLGGIYSGAFTPTEAAGVAGFCTLILCAAYYRTLGPRELFVALVDGLRTTGQVACIVFGAFVFSYILTVERVPQAIADVLQAMDMSRVQFFLVVNVILLVLGCFMDTVAIIMVVVPLLLPSVVALGIDPIHFGIVVTLNVTIGLITPPYGVVLYVVSAVNHIPFKEIVKETWIFIAMLVGLLFTITYIPELALFLPKYFGFAK